MNHKQRLMRQLNNARHVSQGLLDAFKTPEQWTYQVHPQANHALWFAGHIGSTDNYFVTTLAPDRARPLAGSEKFDMGSQPTSNPAEYPDVEQVLEYMRERRATLLAILEGLSEADLDKPTPPGSPDFIPDYASVFEAATWHEGLHTGQISVARRALGHAPLFPPS